jgi:hypothetical protein
LIIRPGPSPRFRGYFGVWAADGNPFLPKAIRYRFRTIICIRRIRDRFFGA